MSTIQSIICFNGGAAGDFLKLACCVSLNEQLSTNSILNGRVEVDNEFKMFINDIAQKKASWEEVPMGTFSPVENAHYFLPEFKNLTRNLFFIDYPDNLNKEVVEAFRRKRFPGNQEKFINHIKNSFPVPMQKLVTADNIINVCNTTWMRNLRNWRNNPDLIAVDLGRFFDLDSFVDIVVRITGQKTVQDQKLREIYSQWIDENQELVNLFTTPCET